MKLKIKNWDVEVNLLNLFCKGFLVLAYCLGAHLILTSLVGLDEETRNTVLIGMGVIIGTMLSWNGFLILKAKETEKV